MLQAIAGASFAMRSYDSTNMGGSHNDYKIVNMVSKWSPGCQHFGFALFKADLIWDAVCIVSKKSICLYIFLFDCLMEAVLISIYTFISTIFFFCLQQYIDDTLPPIAFPLHVCPFLPLEVCDLSGITSTEWFTSWLKHLAKENPHTGRW